MVKGMGLFERRRQDRERRFSLYEERKRAVIASATTPTPTCDSTSEPSCEPMRESSFEPTCEPTSEPTSEPSFEPTHEPPHKPAIEPSHEPTAKKLFSEVPRIEGERIVLDRVVDADADALLDLIQNPLVQRYEPTYLFEKQRVDVHETIRLLYGDLFESRESLILAIRPKESGELAGLAEFYGLREPLHKVSIGYRLRERFWGHGLATETARLMVAYLYGETDIEIITASTMVENAASAHVLQKADFIRTAVGVEEDWGFPAPTVVDKWFC